MSGSSHSFFGRRFPAASLATPALAALVAAGAFLSVPAPAQAQTAQRILAQAMERHEARLAGVEDLTIRQEVMGFSTTAYLVKEMVDGHPVLVAQSVDAAGADVDPIEATGDLWADPLAFYGEWADRWTLEGQGSAEGRTTWRLVLTDFEGLDMDDPAPGHEDPWEPSRLELELDADRFIPLVMTMEGEAVTGTEARPMSVVMRFSDYREVDGYLHPFLTVMETDLAGAGLSPEEAAEARQGLEELRQQLQEVPEAQREMMERMMGDHMAQLEEMLAGGGFQMEVRVTDLRVNAGPPGGR